MDKKSRKCNCGGVPGDCSCEDKVPVTVIAIGKRKNPDLDEGEELPPEDGIPMTKFTVIGKRKNPDLDEGEELPPEDDIPVTKVTVTGKRGDASSIESGMGHLKYLRDQLAEETDEEEIANIKNDIKEWSSIMLEKHKSKPPTEEGEGEGEKKKKKKVVSLMDLFNPSRPMGMR